MDPPFLQLGLSLLLGLLVGLEREHASTGVAGLRTFPLVTLLGTTAALLSQMPLMGGWVLGFGMFGVTTVVALAVWLRPREANGRKGVTTGVAMLLMYAVGALLAVKGMTPVAVALGGTVAVLLQFKPELHGIAQRLGDDDLRAIMQFVLITCIILPVLPNDPIDPYGVVRPWNVWLMVVLIVGMSLSGYIIYKFFGQNAGILLGGLLGGIVSSTATTVSYARTAKAGRTAGRAAAVVILLASSVMFVRVAIESAVVNRPFAATLIVPVAIVGLATLAPGLWLWWRIRRASASADPAQPVAVDAAAEHSNPTQLRSAVVFGLTYALVLLGLAVAKQYVGAAGFYVVAALSGLTEVDALTLSTARMATTDPTLLAQGWKIVLLGTLTNFLSKAAIAGLLGGWAFFVRLSALFALPMTVGLALLLFV